MQICWGFWDLKPFGQTLTHCWLTSSAKVSYGTIAETAGHVATHDCVELSAYKMGNSGHCVTHSWVSGFFQDTYVPGFHGHADTQVFVLLSPQSGGGHLGVQTLATKFAKWYGAVGQPEFNWNVLWGYTHLLVEGSPIKFAWQLMAVTQEDVKLSEKSPNEQILTHLPTTLSEKVGNVHSSSQNPVAKSPKVPAAQLWVQFPVDLSIK